MAALTRDQLSFGGVPTSPASLHQSDALRKGETQTRANAGYVNTADLSDLQIPTELELIEREIKRLQIAAALLYRASHNQDPEMAAEMRLAARWVGERAYNLAHLPWVKEARDLRLARNIPTLYGKERK